MLCVYVWGWQGSTAIDDTIPNLYPEKSSILTDEDSLWYLRRDIDDPTGKEKTPEDAGEPVRLPPRCFAGAVLDWGRWV